MRLFTSLLLTTAISFGASQQAYSFFDAQALVGKREAKIDGVKNDGDELTLAVHLDPIPLVPVGFGLSLSHVNFSGQKSLTEVNFEDAVGQDYVFEIMAWLPFDLFGVTPYAKVGSTIGGNYKLKNTIDPNEVNQNSQPEDVTYKPEGSHLSVGLNWSPLPLIGILVEYKNSDQKLKKSGRPTQEYKSTSLLFGVEIGI